MRVAFRGPWVKAALAGLLVCAVFGFRLTGLDGRSHEDVFSKTGVLRADAAQLRLTVVTPHLETPIEEGRNVLWCGTFQLAWNEVCALIGEDVHFATDPPMVAALNRRSFTRDHVDTASHVSLAGYVGKGIFARIKRELRKTFGGRATPGHLPSPSLTPRPEDIVAYSYLFKHLEFETPFERLDRPLEFAGTEVAAFGLAGYKPAHETIYPQVRILDYGGPNDFVIELQSRSEADRLILAKTVPQETFEDTISAVLVRVGDAEPIGMSRGDVLAVPRFNFDVTRQYGELMGRGLVVKNPKVAEDLVLLAAVQNIRFEMDEKGVRLRSESTLQFGCAANAPPRPQHLLIFDKPFLILMMRKDAGVPYFALWAETAELMVPAKS